MRGVGRLSVSSAALICLAAAHPIFAANIDGRVIIRHRLTKRRVTAAASAYQRGMTVELDPGIQGDSLSFERARVVVYLDGEMPAKPVTATLEQKDRQFGTDTLVIPAGSTVSFPNRDPIFHNVFSLSKPKTFDLGNFPQDHTRNIVFPKAGIVFVNCHLHPNMAAAIVVSPNQWSTKADDAGRFTLAGVPPGDYTIVAWHRAAGFFRQRIKVAPNRANFVEFTIPLDENGKSSVVAQR